MKKYLLIGLIILLITLGGIASCGPSKASVAGTYVNQDNPEWYIELKKDGTFYSHEAMGLVFTGEWEVEGDQIILKSPLGIAVTGKIEGDTIITIDPITGDEVIYKKGKPTQEGTSAPSEEEPICVAPDNFDSWAEAAISWAMDKIDSREWSNYCLRFVSNAFRQQGPEPEGEWDSAWEASQNLTLCKEEPQFAPRGALIFFGKTADNQYGHVGICLGNRNLIHAYGEVRIDDILLVDTLDKGRLIGQYIGWAYPPEKWRPVAPGQTEEGAVYSVSNYPKNPKTPGEVVAAFLWLGNEGKNYEASLLVFITKEEIDKGLITKEMAATVVDAFCREYPELSGIKNHQLTKVEVIETDIYQTEAKEERWTLSGESIVVKIEQKGDVRVICHFKDGTKTEWYVIVVRCYGSWRIYPT